LVSVTCINGVEEENLGPFDEKTILVPVLKMKPSFGLVFTNSRLELIVTQVLLVFAFFKDMSTN
jgi:hypothetical protein